MKRFSIVIGLLFVLLASLNAQAQRVTVYRLKVDDLLRIQVFNQQQIQADVPIGKDGLVSAPFIGMVQAEGKTSAELEADLVLLYKAKLRLREPIVSVSILHYRGIRASIGGAVNRPNTYELRQGDNVLSLLTQGGGAITDFADLRRAYLQRANSRELIPIDLYSMLIRGDTSQNYAIEDGDALIVPPETQNRINIQGKVQSPGQYPYREPMTLADAISLARGDVPYRSRMSKIVIARQRFGQPGQYIRIDVDFVKFVRQGDQTQNVVLQPGDFIYVPETNTPDFNQISALANVAFVFNNVSGLFGFRLFK